MSDRSLHVLLILGNHPVFPPWYQPIIHLLGQRKDTRLTVVGNGLPVSLDSLLSNFKIPYELRPYPLAVPPALLLARELDFPESDYFLFIHDDLLWEPDRIDFWIDSGAADKWTAIHPIVGGDPRVSSHHIADPSISPVTNDDIFHTSRFFQEPRRVMHMGVHDMIRSSMEAGVPPCLFFKNQNADRVRSWLLRETWQIMLGCDFSSYAWHGPNCMLDDQRQRMVSIEATMARWQQAIDNQDRFNLEKLLERSPNSPNLYLQLAHVYLPDREQAIDILQTALRRGLCYPQILDLLQSLLPAEEAEIIGHYREQRYGGRVGRLGSLGNWAGLCPPRPTLAVVVREGEGLENTLANIQDLADEIITVGADPRVNPRVHPDAEWILLLNAGDSLSTQDRQFINNFLWNNPPGLKVFLCRVKQPSCTRIFWEERLFPNDPNLRIEDALLGRIRIGEVVSDDIILKGVTIQAQYRPSSLYELDLLEEAVAQHPEQPDRHLFLGEIYLEQSDLSKAIFHFKQARDRWLAQREKRNHLSRMWLQVASIRYLEMLVKTGQTAVALTESRHLEAQVRRVPDYWYVFGVILKANGLLAPALDAFRYCLHFKGREDELTVYFHTDCIERLPLLQMVMIYRQQQVEMNTSAGILTELLDCLGRLLDFHSDGDTSPKTRDAFFSYGLSLNLYLFLAQACIQAYRQPDISFVSSFKRLCPDQNWLTVPLARHSLTALLFFAEELETVAARLNLPLEQVTDWHITPSLLMPQAEKWVQEGTDGKILAHAFMFCAAAWFQDVNFEVYLARVLLHQGDRQAGEAIFLDILQRWPSEPKWYYQVGMTLCQIRAYGDAVPYLEKALNLQPDFKDARESLNGVLEVLALKT